MTDAIKTVLEEAALIVAEARVPDDLREIAFAKAVDQLVADRASNPVRSLDERGETQLAWMITLESATQKTREELEEVFFESDDGAPLISVNPTRLGKGAAAPTRHAILLIAGARQVGMVESVTSSDHLRDECKRLGVFDTNNFGKTLAGMRDWLNITGSGRSKRVGLKPKGREAFRQLLDDLLSNDGG